MAVSRSPKRDRNSRSTDQSAWGPMVSRYDLILTLIPVLLGIGAVANLGFDVAMPLAFLPTSAAGVLLLVDALVLHPPTQSGDPPVTGSSAEEQ
jgi:hypothetical protein